MRSSSSSGRRVVRATSGVGILMLLTAGLARAELPTPTATTAAIDTLLKGAFPSDRPGAAVIVVKDGRTLFRKAYGMADLELGVPLQPDMVFRLGSITKQFTAAAILMLAEEGRPALYDAYVGDYELAPGFVLTVTREGDRLMTQATGQQKVEVFPSSETEFFLRVVDAQITFVRGPEGKVDQLVLHQGGRDMPAKKRK